MRVACCGRNTPFPLSRRLASSTRSRGCAPARLSFLPQNQTCTNRRRTMDVILLERVGKLGHMGDTVRVKDGYARNFLLPRGKALRATEANKKKFEAQRADLEARNDDLKRSAGELSAKVDGTAVVIIRQAGETGQLYGSVSARDIAEALSAAGRPVQRGHVAILHPIKTLGLHLVPIHLHPELEAKVTVNVARSPEQAERQATGEDLTVREETSM